MVKEEKIKRLIKILKESDISEITVEEEGVKITVRKGPLTILESSEKALGQKPVSSRESQQEGVQEAKTAYKEIVSPMVGTFYRAPAPDADPFVEVGDVVEKGQTLCIIEAMKLMNEIAAEEKGKIVKILVENAQPVEYGQPLFLLEPLD